MSKTMPIWCPRRLQDVASEKKFAIVDGPFGTQLHADEYVNEGVPLVRVTNTSYEGRFLENDIAFITEHKANILARSEVVPDDIIVAKTGATIGKLAMFPPHFTKGIIASSCIKISIDPAKADPKFVFFLLSDASGQKQILNAAGGSTRTTINCGPFGAISFKFPLTVSEQRWIAEILSTVDEAIEQTEALIAKYQQIKAGLMHDLFTRGVTADGRLRPTRVQAPHLYKESPFGWIPKEWDVQRLDSVSEVSRGKFTIRPRNDPRFYGGQYPFIQTGDVALSGGRTLNSYSQTLNEMGLSVSRLFPLGTIMVTIAANIADTCIIGIPMCAPDSLVGVQPKARENARFIELSIRRRKLWLEARAPQTAQRNINLEDLRPLLISWPDGLERLRISEMFEAQDTTIATSQTEVHKLRQQKHGLMQDLLSGRVRVKVAETASI